MKVTIKKMAIVWLKFFIIFLEENIGENLCDLILGKVFLSKTQKP